MFRDRRLGRHDGASLNRAPVEAEFNGRGDSLPSELNTEVEHRPAAVIRRSQAWPVSSCRRISAPVPGGLGGSAREPFCAGDDWGTMGR
jgi:hypothetical protein